MGLSAENKQRADRGLRAAFVDKELPKWPGAQPAVAGALVETIRNLLHASDRYGIDLLTVIHMGTLLYQEDQPDPLVEATVAAQDGRNSRRWGIRRRSMGIVPPSPGPTPTAVADEGDMVLCEPRPVVIDDRVKRLLAEPSVNPFEFDEGLL